MIREIFDYVLSLLKSRLVPMVLVFIILFSVLISRLFSLQIINGESYKTTLAESVKKTTSVSATRGRIFDKNGVLLAYNELGYAVVISDSGVYKNNKTKNAAVNSAINKTLDILDSKGDTYSNNFQIEYIDEGIYGYTVSGNSLLRFQRDSYGKSKISELSEEQKNSSANDMVDFLCNKYELDKSQYSPEHLLEILYLRLLMSANSYTRYMTFTIANEVSDETVAAILENSGELIGVTVEEQYIRKYIDSVYCSQIIGYTGVVSASELETLKQTNEDYESNDVVGKNGIEKSMEQYLSGTKGSKTVYVDTVGRITQVLEETEASVGNDVYLTIDIELQKKLYYQIEDELVDILLTNLTSNNSKYTYSEDGKISHVYITQKEVYFALIDNNILDIDSFGDSDSEILQSIYNTFTSEYNNTVEWLRAELQTSPSPYSSLSDIKRELIWYVYNDILKPNRIFVSANVDTNDRNYKTWIGGGTLSLEEFLKYSISKNWIDMSVLTNQQYVSLQESYDILVEYILKAINTETNFHKKVYNILIESGKLSGRYVCLALYEQGVLEKDDYYNQLKSGSLSSYQYIRNAISDKLITPAQLALKPCSGSIVVTNPNTGDIIALVSYPSYDNNMLSGSVDAAYYKKLLNDNSKPLYNWATQSQMAPGSIYKVCTSIAALDTGIISNSTSFFCSGVFEKVTPNPKCWNHSGHGTEVVATAIRDSCNIFFYNVGYNLAFSKTGNYDSSYATSVLQNYAEQLGLATLCGIEIEEKAPHPSDENAIASAIGQGNHAYSTLNMARYVTTVANSGTCYNLTLVDKVVASDGTVVLDNKAKVSNTMNISGSIWDTVHMGMNLGASVYAPLMSIGGGHTFAAKTGTAQEREDEPNHATMVSYTPNNNPEICVAVGIPNGYDSLMAQQLTARTYKTYFEVMSSE